MLVKPNLFFDGRAEEAIEFYQKVFGVEVVNVVRFKDFPTKPGSEPMSEEIGKRIANAKLIFEGSSFNVCDVLPPQKIETGNHIGMDAVFKKEDTRIKNVFEALSEGGTITQPLREVFFSPCYGELIDRFGIKWAVMQM